MSTNPGSAAAVMGGLPASASTASDDSLRATEEQFRAFFELSGAGMAQTDLHTGRLLRVNAALCAFLGYAADELVGMAIAEFTHPDDRAAHLARFSALTRGESPTYVAEKRYVRKDGRIVWGMVTASVVRDAGGCPLRTVALIQDITKRRLAEEALRESEARVRDLLDSTLDGMMGLDLEGRCTFVNAACLRLLGYTSADEVLGRSMHALMHHSRPDGSPYPEDACRIHDALRAAASTDEDGEVFFRRDGSAFPVIYRASPVVREGPHGGRRGHLQRCHRAAAGGGGAQPDAHAAEHAGPQRLRGALPHGRPGAHDVHEPGRRAHVRLEPPGGRGTGAPRDAPPHPA